MPFYVNNILTVLMNNPNTELFLFTIKEGFVDKLNY